MHGSLEIIGISSWIVYAGMTVDNKQIKLFKLYNLKSLTVTYDLFIALAIYFCKGYPV